MNVDLLFICLQEEAAEVQQAVSKSIRFGPLNHNPDTPTSTNVDDIMTEYYHMQTVVEMLQEKGRLPILSREEIKEIKNKKKKKLLFYDERRRNYWQEKHIKQKFK